MPDGFTIDLSQIKAIQERMKDLPAKMSAMIDVEIQDGARAIAAEAKLRAPGDYGFLKNEIGSAPTGLMQATVFSAALYSPYVEFGTRANVQIPAGLEEYAAQFKGPASGVSSLAAKEAIFAWCKRKGIEEEAWYAIYVSLMTKGIRANPFFFPAFNRIQPIIINKVLKILAEDAFSSKTLYIRDSIV